MWDRKKAIIDIFNKHGEHSLYISPTGYISRAIYELFPMNKNIFYMQGSMGLTPAIGLGLALNTSLNIVVINGDAAFLMHLGITHTIRDFKLNNLFIYILDNGCHESVGGDACPPLDNQYVSVNKIYKINKNGKKPRVQLDPLVNKKQFIKLIKKESNEK